MKKYMLLSAMLISGVVLSQNVSPKHEAEGNLVKATYFHENGVVSQEGFYKAGKIHGKWISYDEYGNKKSIGEYNKGEKIGKWFFWNERNLSEIDYSNNRVTSVKNWKEDALVIRN